MFYPFLQDASVRLIGVEAAGEGLNTRKHSATISCGTPGVLHGARSYLIQDQNGQVAEVHSISAGLDYPGVGPEHSYLKDIGRVQYTSATDSEALEGLTLLSETEGIIPALESAHAVAEVMKMAPETEPDEAIVLCLSGRGDKDVEHVEKYLNLEKVAGNKV
jgi:tryptophan synthase beta subunit